MWCPTWTIWLPTHTVTKSSVPTHVYPVRRILQDTHCTHAIYKKGNAPYALGRRPCQLSYAPDSSASQGTRENSCTESNTHSAESVEKYQDIHVREVCSSMHINMNQVCFLFRTQSDVALQAVNRLCICTLTLMARSGRTIEKVRCRRKKQISRGTTGDGQCKKMRQVRFEHACGRNGKGR